MKFPTFCRRKFHRFLFHLYVEFVWIIWFFFVLFILFEYHTGNNETSLPGNVSVIAWNDIGESPPAVWRRNPDQLEPSGSSSRQGPPGNAKNPVSSSGVSTGTIVGSTFSVLGVLMVAAFGFYMCNCRRRVKSTTTSKRVTVVTRPRNEFKGLFLQPFTFWYVWVSLHALTNFWIVK